MFDIVKSSGGISTIMLLGVIGPLFTLALIRKLQSHGGI